MGLFSRRQNAQDAAPQERGPDVECPHTSLVPHWNRMEDIGHEDRATEYRCDSCHTSFSHADADRLRASEAERLRSVLS